MKICIFGGQKEIGGNKILLSDADTKIFMDFGISYGLNSQYLSEFLKLRDGAGLKDYFALGMLPKLKGIYNLNIADKTEDFFDPQQSSINGILVSHAHGDHIGYIPKLRPEIPIYCSAETKAFMEYLDEVSFVNPEYTSVSPKFKFYTNKKGALSRVKSSEENRISRNIIVVESGIPFMIGNLKITPFEVDHSLRGAMAFLIETSKGIVLYTGDLRFHGWRADKTEFFIQECKKREIAVLITEGTRAEDKNNLTEQYLVNLIIDACRDKPYTLRAELIITQFPARDIDRMYSFYRASVELKRKLVVDMKQAKLLDLWAERFNLDFADDIRIHIPPKSWHLINRKGEIDDGLIEQDYQIWERKYLNDPRAIYNEEIKRDQTKFILYLSNYSIQNLIDIKPNYNSIFIRSSSEPFSDEMEIDNERFMNWYKLMGINEDQQYQLHCSGHAPFDKIKEMIHEINPKFIIPVHTSEPEKFDSLNSKFIIVHKKSFEL